MELILGSTNLANLYVGGKLVKNVYYKGKAIYGEEPQKLAYTTFDANGGTGGAAAKQYVVGS